MFVGFDFKAKDEFEDYVNFGNQLYSNVHEKVKFDLKKYTGIDGSIDAEKMKEDWFPDVDANIFISHSHKDEKIAIGLAGFLKEKYDLNVFIDSCIWGYSNDLLKKIDDKYCRNSEENLYSYKKRNLSTSHIHIILSTALMRMINKTECIVFLNTPNASTVKDTINCETNSPWIYSEILTTKIIEKKKLSEERMKRLLNESITIEKSFSETPSLDIKYSLNYEHLYELNYSDFKKINEKGEKALDQLYMLKNIL